ncbi:MAG: acyl-CoA dehydrogenase family protein [Pseudomonadota bacterium]
MDRIVTWGEGRLPMPMILNEEQIMLRDAAKDFCANNTPITQLRQLRDDNDANGFDTATWQSMVELGWAGIPFPEDYGGLDFGYKGLGVVTQETGRTLAASPLIASIWTCGTLLNLAGKSAQKNELLPQLAAGELLMALALEESHRHAPNQIATKAKETKSGYSISGEKTFVLDGHVASKLIVVARTEGKKDERKGITLFLVDADADGISIERTLMVDSRNAANVTLKNVKVSSKDVIGRAGRGASVLDEALDIARIGVAAEMLGSAEECFERTVQYLKEREQFGVPIGSFQALKHRAANMFCELELSKSVVLEALTALDEGRDKEEIAKLASLAKYKVGETFHTVSREGIQMHGGIGMTDEFEIGFFIKRAAVAEITFGDQSYHRNRYGELEGY